MKMIKYFFTLTLTLSSFLLFAQSPDQDIQISLGYFGHGAIQPGAKIGVSIPINSWETEKRTNTFFASPQIATYSKNNFYTSLLLNSEFGIHRQRKEGKYYSVYSIGLGYINIWEVLTVEVDLGGKILSKERESRGFFYPSINYEFGRNIGEQLSIYSQLTVGKQFASKWENAGQFFLGLGVKYKLN